ncbi:hypothetical protein ABVT39_003123 [Epinephelus coioides]
MRPPGVPATWEPQTLKPNPQSDQYLMEFLEDGGALTLLDILSQSQSKEEEKAEALCLLLAISNAGCKYKEIICESHGVKATAECLAKSNADETQETACALLKSLSHGNPKYQNQIYKGLIALMTCTSPMAQQLVLHTLRTVQSKMKTAHHSIVEPLLNTLRSPHLEVQDEAINLILELKCYDVRPLLLSGLVALLRPTQEEVKQHQIMEGYTIPSECEIIKMTESLPVFVQQAAAAKTIRYVLLVHCNVHNKQRYKVICKNKTKKNKTPVPVYCFNNISIIVSACYQTLWIYFTVLDVLKLVD